MFSSLIDLHKKKNVMHFSEDLLGKVLNIYEKGAVEQIGAGWVFAISICTDVVSNSGSKWRAEVKRRVCEVRMSNQGVEETSGEV